MLARKGGRLLKGGEADMGGVAKMVLNDFMRGKLPWFTAPPKDEEGEDSNFGVDLAGREGRLGEMRKKRTASDMENTADGDEEQEDDEGGEEEEEEWGGIQDPEGGDDEGGDDEVGSDGGATLVPGQDTEDESEPEEDVEEPRAEIKPQANSQKRRKRG